MKRLIIVWFAAIMMTGVLLAAEETEKGLVAHYTFDENSGLEVRDASGNGNNGKIMGANFVPQCKGFALEFDGTNDWVDFGSGANGAFNITNAITLEAWIYPDDVGPDEPGIVGKGGSIPFGYGLTYNKTCYFYVGHGANHVAAPCPLKTWSHVAGTYDGKELKMYLDGRLINAKASSHALDVSDHSFVIGRSNNAKGLGYFKGLIDEVRVYDRAISEDDLRSHFIAGAQDKGKELVRIAPDYGNSTFLKTQTMTFDCDLKNLGNYALEGGSLEMKFTLTNQSTALLTTNLPLISGATSSRFDIPVERIPEGVYNLKATVRNAAGATIAGGSLAWMRPKWLGSKEGFSDLVLPPWTPIKFEKNESGIEALTWGRACQFNGGIFPSQIKSQNENLLQRPVTLWGSAGGQGIYWQTAGNYHLESATGAKVVFFQEAVSSNGLLKIAARTQVDYDGMVRFDWTLETVNNVTLDELFFEIEMPARSATLLSGSDLEKAKMSNRKDLPAPLSQGRIPPDGYKGKFCPYLWIGSENRGLAWFTESDEHWHVANPGRVTEIVRQGDSVILRLHLVDKPMTLERGRNMSYTFGLQATPVRPMGKTCWDYRITSEAFEYWANPPFDSYRKGFHDMAEIARLGGKIVVMANWTDILPYSAPVGHPAVSDPVRHCAEELKKIVPAYHEKGIKVLVYFGFQVSELAPEWPFFGATKEVLLMPEEANPDYYAGYKKQIAHRVCYKSVWQDFLVDGIARLMDEYDIDGVYLDTTSQIHPCQNAQHGCGYRKSDGSVVPVATVFSSRETLRRIYTAVKSRKPDGIVDLHSGSGIFVPTVAWATDYWYGEGLGYTERTNSVFTNGFFTLDFLPLDQFRADFMGHNYGVPAEFLCYNKPYTTQEAFALTLLHDVPIRAHCDKPRLELLARLWNVFDAFGRTEAEWLPYWRNMQYVEITPAGVNDQPGAYVSLYRHPRNGILAVISNLSRGTADVTVKFDPAKLGLTGKSLVAKDAFSGEALNMTNGVLFLPAMGIGEWKMIRVDVP